MTIQQIEILAREIEEELLTSGLFEGISKDYSIKLIRKVLNFLRPFLTELIDGREWVFNTEITASEEKQELIRDIASLFDIK